MWFGWPETPYASNVIKTSIEAVGGLEEGVLARDEAKACSRREAMGIAGQEAV